MSAEELKLLEAKIESLSKQIADHADTIDVLLHKDFYRLDERVLGPDVVLDEVVADQKRIRKTTNGWVRCKSHSDEEISLPSTLLVQVTETKNGRDYFVAKEGGKHIRNKRFSVKTGYLDGLYSMEAAVEAVFEKKSTRNSGKYDSTLTIKRNNEVLGTYDCFTDKTNPPVSGIIELPDFPHSGGADYGDLGTVWFRIGTSGDKYIHPGRASIGCITCQENSWDDIYDNLISSRGSASTIGKITIK